MVENSKSVWPAVILLSVLLLGCTAFEWSAINNVATKPVNVDLTEVATAINTLSTKIDTLTPTASIDTPVVDTSNIVTTKHDVQEAKALEIATAYVNSNDFKKLFKEAIVTLACDGQCDLESYRDITQIKLSDTEVTHSGDDYTVTFENVKVYYYTDGDEEETERALLDEFDVEVENVDFDEEFEDAEAVDLTSITIDKVYQ